MRVVSVFVFTFVLIGLLIYGMCAFASTVPNPMNWTQGGRAALCIFILMFGTFGGLGAAVMYEETH